MLHYRKHAVRLGLCTIAAVLGMIPSAFAGPIELLNVDFENVNYEEFKELDSVTIKPGISSDNLTIAEESDGNYAFRIFREEDEVKDNTTQLGFNYKLPTILTSGKVNVSFRMKAEGAFRSRWRDLGSAMTSGNTRNLFLFSQLKYGWAQATGSGYFNCDLSAADVWYDVKYELDLDNKMVVIGVAKPGTTMQMKEKSCTGGNFASLEFTVAKQHNSWAEYGTEGDIIYWIDDIKVSINGVKVVSTSIDGSEDNAPVNSPLAVTFDEPIADEKVTADAFILTADGVMQEVIANKSGDKVIEIEPVGGFEYNKEYSLTVKPQILSGLTGVDYVKEFKTVSVIDCDIENGKRYNEGFLPVMNTTEEITYNTEVSVDGGEFAEYDFTTPFTEPGEYVVRITATDTYGKTQSASYSFTVIGQTAPLIDGEVTITGEPVTGSTLVAEYVFRDENDDGQDFEKTVHQWYRISKDGNEEKIGENLCQYTLTEADEDCYIKFTVIPYSDAEPFEGEIYESELFVGAMNPTVDNISVSGTVSEGEVLSVSYDYYDENGDEEIKDGDGKSKINWYSSENENDGFEKIGEGNTYVLGENDNNRFIKIGIVPKNAGSGRQDTEFLSEVIAGAFAPVAENVKITGTLKSGNVVGVNYQFNDLNGDSERGSIIKWYVADKLVSESESYKIKSSDSGKKIYVKVIPRSENMPYEGEAVQSKTATIASSENKSYSSAGGGGGGGYTPPAVTPDKKPDSADKDVENTDDNTEDTDKKDNETTTVFNDMSGHWAEAEVKSMTEKGILKGKTENTFMPDDSIKRAELAAIIARVYGLSGDENSFSDVAETDWFAKEVSAVYKNGYMNGSDGLFRPNDQITRQEIAVVLMNILEKKETNEESQPKSFKDSGEISSWAIDAVNFVSSRGIMQGVDAENFDPTGLVTRAQAAVILSRITK